MLRRGYFPGDIPILQAFGCASSFASGIVLALFVGSDLALLRYATPELLWGIVPLIVFWQCRLWRPLVAICTATRSSMLCAIGYHGSWSAAS